MKTDVNLTPIAVFSPLVFINSINQHQPTSTKIAPPKFYTEGQFSFSNVNI